MGAILSIIPVGFFLCVIATLVVVRKMDVLAKYSTQNQIPIYGRYYPGATLLYADLWFQWRLLKKGGLEQVNDSQMRLQMRKIRSLLVLNYALAIALTVFLVLFMFIRVAGN